MRHQTVLMIAGLLIVNLFLAGFLLFDHLNFNKSIVNTSEYPELQTIKDEPQDFDHLLRFFSDLAKQKGGRYAFQVLKKVELAPNIDVHLLGHAVGDVLYKQEGVDGITACDNDFRNACSHAIVIGVFDDRGEKALPEISTACRKAPGGSGAYTMCFHGLGHGILAYVGFDMAKAAAVCKKTGTAAYNYNESTQCIGGTVMEIIGGGFHDRQIWTAQRAKYLNKYKPLSLCESDFIPRESKFMCYDYLTPYLFEAVGASLGSPTASDFEKAFKFCAAIPESRQSDRAACFGGFGKEFDGLVQNRDIRQVSLANISSEKLKQIYDWCLLAGNTKDVLPCINSAMSSLYWGGENDKSIAIRFCSQVTDLGLQKSCFTSLIGSVASYVKDSAYRKSFCEAISTDYQADCRRTLGL